MCSVSLWLPAEPRWAACLSLRLSLANCGHASLHAGTMRITTSTIPDCAIAAVGMSTYYEASDCFDDVDVTFSPTTYSGDDACRIQLQPSLSNCGSKFEHSFYAVYDPNEPKGDSAYCIKDTPVWWHLRLVCRMGRLRLAHPGLDH